MEEKDERWKEGRNVEGKEGDQGGRNERKKNAESHKVL